jgi:hypothetical protein
MTCECISSDKHKFAGVSSDLRVLTACASVEQELLTPQARKPAKSIDGIEPPHVVPVIGGRWSDK